MTQRRRSQAKKLGRRVETRTPKKTLLVFCEGRITEPDYLHALNRDPTVRKGASVNIKVATTNAVPLPLVEIAVEAKERALEDEIDEVWCVFDVESPTKHPNLPEAIALANQHDVKLAISNPCFELWLILHFEDQTAHLDTTTAECRRKVLDGESGKGVKGLMYMPKRQVAAQRAIELDRRHTQNHTLHPDDNPSSGMHQLLNSIEPQSP